MIEYSKEVITHFKCMICDGWWTIGDWKGIKEMRCPHCGAYHNHFKKMTPEN